MVKTIRFRTYKLFRLTVLRLCRLHSNRALDKIPVQIEVKLLSIYYLNPFYNGIDTKQKLRA